MPVFSTQLSGSILGQLTGSLLVKGPVHVTGSIYTTQIVSASRFDTKGILSGSQLKVGPTSITGSLFISQHSNQAHPPFEPEILLSKNDSTILAGDMIGSIHFRGEDSTTPGVGASISTKATANWLATQSRSTNIEFFTQDNTGNDTLQRPRMTVSGSGVVGFEQGAHTHILQVGISNDGDVAPDADSDGIKARISSKDGNAKIAVDADENSVSGFILEKEGGATGRVGWYAAWGTAAHNRNRFSFKNAADAIGDGAIVIHNNMNSVRIGGGDYNTGGAHDKETDYSLVVTSSDKTRPSGILLSSQHGSQNNAGVPILAWNYENNNTSAANSGYWQMGIEPNFNSLTIGAPGIGTSMTGFAHRETAMVFKSGGAATRVGIGGAPSSSTWPVANSSRALMPSATLHIENQRNVGYELQRDGGTYTAGQLLIGNSYSSNSPTDNSTGILFDNSSDSNPQKWSAEIQVARDPTATQEASKGNLSHTAYMSFGLYDGSGYVNSTRSRLRIAHDGATIIMSGTQESNSNAGWPRNEYQYYRMDQADVPSGSLTLMSLMDGTHGKDPATLNLVSWTGLGGSKGHVVAGDNLGRIAWWSADVDFNLSSERSKQVSAFIDVEAAGAHSAANNSPSTMLFYTRKTGGAHPEVGILLDNDQNTQFFGAVTVNDFITITGNKIKDSGGSAAITFDGSQNTQLAGDLAVIGRDITSAGITGTANIFTDTGGNFINIGGDGSTTSVKTLNVAADDITDSNNNTVISFDGTGNIDGLGQINQDVVIGGTSPRLTIGDGENEVTSLVFDASPMDFHFGQKSGTAMIGGGATVGALQSLMVSGSGISWFGHGVSRSPSIYVTDWGGRSILANYWVKFAEVPASAGMYARQIQGLFLVNIEGFVGAQAGQNSTFLVESKVTPLDATPGYYNDPSGTTLSVEVFDAGVDAGTGTSQGLQGFDPSTDICMVSNDHGGGSGQGHSYELWIKSKLPGKECYVTHLGGTGTDQMPLSDACRPSFRICDGKGWQSALPSPVGSKSGKLFGKWVSKVFDAVRVVSSVAAFGTLGRLTLQDQEIDVSAGSLLIDVAGDISLDAGDKDIVFQNTGSPKFVFNLENSPAIDITGNFTINCSGDINLDAGGGDVLLHNNGVYHSKFDINNNETLFYEPGATTDYFKIAVYANGSTVLSTEDVAGATGHLYLRPDGGVMVDSVGSVSNLYGLYNSGASYGWMLEADASPRLHFYAAGTIASAAALTLDATGDVTIDGGGGEIYFKDDGVSRGYINSSKLDVPGDVDAGDDVYVRGIASNSSHTDSQYVKIYINDGQGASNEWKLLRYTSTAKIKKNIADLPEQPGLEHILQLTPRRWDSKNGLETDCAGFIAEEVYDIHPLFGALGPDFDYEDSTGKNKRIKHTDPDNGKITYEDLYLSDEKVPNNIHELGMMIGLVNSVRTLKEQNDALVARIAALENS